MAELVEPGRWKGRDWVAGIALFLATAGFVLWQNAHIAVLWDLSYLLDTSWRIVLGQMPYHDFPLVHPPGTFLIQAMLMRLLGRCAWIPIGYAAIAGGTATVLAWRMILHSLERRVQVSWATAFALAAPLSFLGIYGIYPHPIYDCDCALALLLALYLLQRLSLSLERGRPRVERLAFFAGVSAVVPSCFKQNIGLPFLVILVAGVCLLIVFRWRGPQMTLERRAGFWLLAGVAAASVGVALLIECTAGWASFWYWTVHFAGQRRLPGFAPLLANYRQAQLLWTLPALLIGRALLKTHRRIWIRLLGAALILAPFFACLIAVLLEDVLEDRADALLALWPLLLLLAAANALYELRKELSLRTLFPFLILALVHGALLSQQLWGSTYALWPFLLVLVAGLLQALPTAAYGVVPGLGCVIGFVFLVAGGVYAAGHDRLSYLNEIAGQPVHATLPALRGLSAPGPYLGDLEELVRFADREIPRGEGILLLPGEEPFFFATGRTPSFPVQIFDLTTDPYTADELMAEARRRGIRWVIVKTRLQSDENPLPEREQTMELLHESFRPYAQLAGYQVYSR